MVLLFVICLSSAPTTLALFFFNATTTTEIYTLSLHDALPISDCHSAGVSGIHRDRRLVRRIAHDIVPVLVDRKSTRLNSSHTVISYAVFCLKKKNSILTAWPLWVQQ